jgi:hypothetical protein
MLKALLVKEALLQYKYHRHKTDLHGKENKNIACRR